MADAYLKAGDTAPSLDSTLQTPDGLPTSIIGADVRLYVQRIRTLESILDAEVAENLEDVDPEDVGQVRYVFDGPLEEGGYNYEWEVTFLDGSIETFPNDRHLTLTVTRDLGEESS